MLKLVSVLFWACLPAYEGEDAPNRRLTVSLWNQLRLSFDPIGPQTPATVSMIIEPLQSIPAGSLVVVILPGFQYTESFPGEVEYTVSYQGNPVDDLFQFYATWDQSNSSLTFNLSSAFTPGTIATISTIPKQFVLPASSPENSALFQVLVTNSDMSQVLVPPTAFFQSPLILERMRFAASSLGITGSDLTISFALSRGAVAGDKITLQLPGYSASTSSPGVYYVTYDDYLFVNDTVSFDPVTFNFTLTLQFPRNFNGLGTDAVVITLYNIAIPDGQYANDPSARIAFNSDPFFPIQTSPAFGSPKKFTFSRLSFDPAIPESVTQVNISFTPSIKLFAGTVVAIHLRGGFSRSVNSSSVAFYGESADLFVSPAVWNGTAVLLTVASNSIVPSSTVSMIWIPVSEGFVLPSILSANDGVLLIEAGEQVVIYPQSIAISPPVGAGTKAITTSSILFLPMVPNQVTSVALSFICNTAILPGSVIQVHLGGFTRSNNVLSDIVLSGISSGKFWKGVWDPNTQNLDLIMDWKSTVAANTSVIVSIAVSQQFLLPNKLEFNDRSIWVEAESLGITGRQFFIGSSQNINPEIVKGFTTSEMWYDNRDIAFPGRACNLSIQVRPNFAILPGSVLVVHLPNFTTNVSIVNVSTIPLVVNKGQWNGSALSLTVSRDTMIAENVDFLISIPNNQFIVPPAKEENDESLGLEVTGNQWLPYEPIKTSPPVIPRQFTYSSLTLDSPDPLTVSAITIQLEASVPITASDLIIVTIPDFSRQAGSGNVSVNGVNGSAVWNETASTLSVQISTAIDPATLISLSIPRAENFLSPRASLGNSPLVTVAVPGSIASSAFKSSPLIGDGPYVDQQYCMRQYESSVRVHVNNEALYPQVGECQPSCYMSDNWIKNACSLSALKKCGCNQFVSQLNASADSAVGFPISGFNMQTSDKLFFSKEGTDCTVSNLKNGHIQQSINSRPSLTNTGSLVFPYVRPLATGRYSVCLLHFNTLFPVGTLTVRSLCDGDRVSYNGVCINHCPSGYVPEYGTCMRITSSRIEDEPIAFQLMLTYPGADAASLGTLPDEDSSLDFFKYDFSKNMKLVLNEVDQGRFVVAGVTSANTDVNEIIVAVVITPSTTTSNRPSGELFLRLTALFSDEESVLYTNNFFSSLNRDYSIKKRTQVMFCSSVGKYLATCPSHRDWGSPLAVPMWYILTVALGGLAAGLAVAGTALALYRLDASDLRISTVFKRRTKDYRVSNDFSVVKITAGSDEKELTIDVSDITKLEPGQKVEFAKTWLDSELLDEPLMLNRKRLR